MRNNQNQKCAFEMSYYNSLHSGVQSLKILVKDVNIEGFIKDSCVYWGIHVVNTKPVI